MFEIYDEKSAKMAFDERLRDAEKERLVMQVAKANWRISPIRVWLGHRLVSLGAFLQQIGHSLRVSNSISAR